jgi:uncharacterized protein YkwD
MTLALLGLLALFGLRGAPGPFSGPASAAAAQCSGASNSPKALSAKRAGQLVICLVNKERRQRGLRPVNRVKTLARAAGRHTAEMKRSDCFAHTCPGEPNLTGRLSKADYLPCNCNWRAGENIAWGAGSSQGSPRSVVKAWMGSGEHRARILDGSYEHIGVGVRHGSPFGGSNKQATYTLDFGAKD